MLCASELRRRREMVARACHELRGPLTAVRLSLATMERRREAPPERLATLDPRPAWALFTNAEATRHAVTDRLLAYGLAGPDGVPAARTETAKLTAAAGAAFSAMVARELAT